MKIKYFIVSLSFLIIAVGNIRAELPYESDQDHTFVVTGGMKWDKPLQNKIQNALVLSYCYDNKIMVGISLHSDSYTYAVYEGTGYANDTGFLNNPHDSVVTTGEDFANRYNFLELAYYGNNGSFTNLYTQLNPFKLLKFDFPVSISLQIAIQDVSDGKDFVATMFIYKNYNINNKMNLQPILSFGYREFSLTASGSTGQLGGALIYYYKLNKHTSFLITPQVNMIWKQFYYKINIGLSYGF